MMEDGGGVTFPVVFFDGENDINMDPVKVDPSMEYKSFQLLLSQMIGISPNQISIYLVDRKKSKSKSSSLSSAPESRRRIPITGKANFAVISREKDCSFLAVLKRARKNRRSKPKHDRLFSDYVSSVDSSFPADNFFLLRRNSQHLYRNPSFDYNDMMRDLEFQRMNYNKAVFFNSNQVSDLKSLDLKSFRSNSILSLTSCEECEDRKFSPEAFHCCVNDAVVTRFRSPAGPIARPVKTF